MITLSNKLLGCLELLKNLNSVVQLLRKSTCTVMQGKESRHCSMYLLERGPTVPVWCQEFHCKLPVASSGGTGKLQGKGLSTVLYRFEQRFTDFGTAGAR